MTGGRSSGEQKLNGRTKSKATLARVMGYVEQNDIHTPALTVIESLRFSAHLRMEGNVNKRSENKFIDNVSPPLYYLWHDARPGLSGAEVIGLTDHNVGWFVVAMVLLYCCSLLLLKFLCEPLPSETV